MGHLPKLIEDLALILFTGAVITLIFKRIKQPLVLGYIIAGLLVGPHISLVPNVADEINVKTLAEVGVIFLLFSLGLEFSFKKLLSVGSTASITAFVEITCIIFGGYWVGQWMGWGTIDSIFLGALLASSSTTIIIRAFDELGMRSKGFANVVFGVLVVEDLVVILILVLLPTIAVSREFEGSTLVFTILKLLFFLVLWFVSGIFLLPTFLKKMRAYLDEETLLIFSIGLCLGMVVLATKAGFSAELGAFIMGSILAETTSAEKIEDLLKPVKNMFGAVFFVSVGMMIDPSAIWDNKWPVLIVVCLTILGKFLSTTTGALISGQPLKQSVQVGMSMAQIGEFAFIIAGLGVTLKVTSSFLYPVAIGVSAITTFTTPYMIKGSEKTFQFISKLLPDKWLSSLQNYTSGTQKIQVESNWKKVIKSYLIIIITNGIVILSIVALSAKFLHNYIFTRIPNPIYAGLIGVFVTLLVAAPFFWGLMLKKPDKLSYKELWLKKKYNQGPLLMIEILRIVSGIVIIGMILDYYFSRIVALIFTLPFILGLYFIFAKKIQKFYSRLENRFIKNLHSREEERVREHIILKSEMDESFDWEVHMATFKISSEAIYLGKSLLELAWREKYGINIAYIKRGENIILAPKRDDVLFPYDEIGIIATDEQLIHFQPVLEMKLGIQKKDPYFVKDVVLQKFVIGEFFKCNGESIRSSKIRELTEGLVIGIERKGNKILNPSSSMILERDDIIWLVGNKRKIRSLTKIVSSNQLEETI